MKPIDIEKHRHRCEVRMILKIRSHSQEAALSYIQAVTARRGKDAGLRLQDDCSAQWQRGNRGEYGVWR